MCVILVAVFHSTSAVHFRFSSCVLFDLRREVRFSMGYIILKCDTTHKWAMVNVTNVISEKSFSEGSEKASG